MFLAYHNDTQESILSDLSEAKGSYIRVTILGPDRNLKEGLKGFVYFHILLPPYIYKGIGLNPYIDNPHSKKMLAGI